AHAEADELRIDTGATLARMLKLLEDQGAPAVAQHEPVAVAIPRPAGFGRSLVAGRERLRLREARKTADRGRHLAAAGDDDIGITVLDGAQPEADCVRRGGAGGHDAEVGSLETVLDGQVPGDHVDDRGGYEERGDLAGVGRLHVLGVLALD